MFMNFGLRLGILTALAAAQTAPPTTQQTPPPNPNDCPLSANSPFGYVVRIWNKTASATYGHGSLISSLVILTSATNEDWQGHSSVKGLEAIGQNIWNTNTWASCMQVKPINASYAHDKCCGSPETSKFFNFMIFVLAKPFVVSTKTDTGEPIYPFLPMTTDPLGALDAITEYNEGDNKSCSIPLLASSSDQKALLLPKNKQGMAVLNYNTTCVPLMCEEEYREEKKGITTEGCKEEYLSVEHDTMMCLVRKAEPNSTQLPNDSPTTSMFYGGAPVICDGTAYGIVSEAFIRDPPKEHSGHILLVGTFLRAYKWIARQQRMHSKDRRQMYVEDWHIAPKYLSSEPTVAYFVDTTKQRMAGSINFGHRTGVGILAFLAPIKMALSCFGTFE